jgi:hypothetical protein
LIGGRSETGVTTAAAAATSNQQSRPLLRQISNEVPTLTIEHHCSHRDGKNEIVSGPTGSPCTFAVRATISFEKRIVAVFN